MNKVILSLSLMFLSTLGHSQNIDFGAKTGVNFSTFRGKDADSNGILTGFHVGGFVRIGITEKFAIQPELLYSQLGSKDEYTEGLINFKDEINLGYIQIPLMVKYYFTDNFSAEVGPYFGLLVSSKIKSEANQGNTTVKQNADLKDHTKGLDAGFGFGLSYDLPIGLNFGARYSLGLTNTFNMGDSNNGVTNVYDVKNDFIQLSVGYKF